MTPFLLVGKHFIVIEPVGRYNNPRGRMLSRVALLDTTWIVPRRSGVSSLQVDLKAE
jgi:hypothetical protein